MKGKKRSLKKKGQHDKFVEKIKKLEKTGKFTSYKNISALRREIEHE